MTLEEWPGLCGPLFFVCQGRPVGAEEHRIGVWVCLVHSVAHEEPLGLGRVPTPSVLPRVVGLREDRLLQTVCFLNSDHGLLGQNVYRVTKMTSGSGPAPGRQQVL